MSAIDAANDLALRIHRGPQQTWEKRVDLWEAFVGEVEAGYQLTIYDYRNDLDMRGQIQEVLDQLSDADRHEVEPPVREADRRFIAATREVDEVQATFDRGFWARRVPKKLVGELAVDLGSDSAQG